MQPEEEYNSDEYTKIKDILPGDKKMKILIILVQFIGKIKLKSDKEITQFKVADDTGCIICNFYDPIGNVVKEGDIIVLKGAYASVFKKKLILYSGKQGFGEVIKIDEFFMVYTDTPNLSDKVYEDKEEQDTHHK